MLSPVPTGPRPRRALLLLGIALSVLALVQATHRARQGRSALLKWNWAFEALEAGEPIYGVGAEGFPTPPVTLLLLRPFHALGGVPGAVLWAAVKIACAWGIVLAALGLCREEGRAPPLVALLVVLLSFRVLLSDVLHGNVNLLVGASVAAAAWGYGRGREGLGGLAAGLGAALKVTPALFLPFLSWKRSARGVAGFLAGAALGLVLLPALFLGFERTLSLDAAWWRQMVAPVLAGSRLTLLQTEHINQSLHGLLARLLTDSVAIVARPPLFPEDVRVNLLSLSPGAFRTVHLAALALLGLALAVAIRPGGARGTARERLGEVALVALAMLLASERSWKHHFVTLPLPLAFVAAVALDARLPRLRRVRAGIALALAGALFGLSGSGVLGARGSDLAEAYGAFTLGALFLFAAIAADLRAARRRPPPALTPP